LKPDAPSLDIQQQRRIYGRGLYDGLKQAGIENPKEFMNSAKQKSIEEGLTGIAKKVYDTMPIGEEVKAHVVVAAIAKLGSRPDYQVVAGCMKSLAESGLVRKITDEVYLRLPPKPKLVRSDAAPIEPQPPAEETTLEKIARAATSLRETADELDAIALEAEEALKNASAENAKLVQLKALLKDL